MNRNYKITYSLVVCILVMALFLQSCGDSSNQVIPTTEVEKTADKKLGASKDINIKSLLVKDLTTSRGNIVTFYEQDGDLQANVRVDEKQPKPNYEGLTVAIEEGTDLAVFLRLDSKIQSHRIQFQSSQNSQPDHIFILKEGGVLGGMKKGNLKKDDEIQEKKVGEKVDESKTASEKNAEKIKEKVERTKEKLEEPKKQIEDRNDVKAFRHKRKFPHKSPRCKKQIEQGPLAKKIKQGKASLEPYNFIEELPDEVMLLIFSFLNQKDIPSVNGTNKRWQKLMDDNQLWKVYAERAHIIINHASKLRDTNYKALVREHCILSFTDLGPLNGDLGFNIRSTNFDSSVIVGYADDGAGQSQRAFRWTSDKGIEFLDGLNGGKVSMAYDTNFDGSVIVGSAVDGAALDGAQVPYRWTSEKGMEFLGTLNGGRGCSHALGVSSNGSVIVGYANDGVPEKGLLRAFRWTAEKGMESLGTLDEKRCSFAHDTNFDGSVIVGYANNNISNFRENLKIAFRWTAEKGMESLGTLNGGTWSMATGISFDGSVITGLAENDAAAGKCVGFKWTAEKGIESLAPLNSGLSISSNGSVIVGCISEETMMPDSKVAPFRWTPSKGIESIEKLLSDKGLLPINWVFTQVSTITPSGTLLIGIGRMEEPIKNPYFSSIAHSKPPHVWRAVIPRGNLF